MVASALFGGCSNKSQRLYQRAEMLFAQGQPYLAAQDYYRLVTEQPHAALADDALYKLGYLYREEFADPQKAIQTYEFLANGYPSSRYADDAFLWILQIQGDKLKDPMAVRHTIAVVRDRFPEDLRVLATAQLQLARTLFAAGRFQEADREAQALITQYPQQERQCASALLTRARCREKLGKPGDDQAVKFYEQIVTRYPNTPGAVEAKRSIGWLYYGLRNTERAQERLAKQRAARTIGNVQPPVLVSSMHLKPFAALSSLLAERGIHAAPEELLVLSGAAFVFAYDPQRPQATTSLLERNALTVAAEQFGFASNVWSASSADGSFASLVQAIGQGRPVMVPQASGGNWLIVTGYRPAEERLFVLSAGSKQPQTLSCEQFIARWARSSSGHTACVSGPYFQLSLGQRNAPPAATAVLRNVARRAAEVMSQGEWCGVPSGDRAYQLLIEQLSELQEGSDPQKLQRLRSWVNSPLSQMLAERRAAAAYVAHAGAGGSTSDAAAQAAMALEEAAHLGMQLRRELQSLLRTASGADAPPEAAWPEVIDRVKQMQSADQKAMAHLAEAGR
jgi:TolA-binding protein